MKDDWHEWCEYVLRPVLAGESLSDETVKKYGGLALLAADTDRTQEYVFESTKLPEIRGGSELLRSLNEDGLLQLLADVGLPKEFVDDATHPGCVIFAGGGGFLAFVPASIAGDLVAKIEEYYPTKTGKATITCVWRSVSSSEIFHGLGGNSVSLGEVNAMRDQLTIEDWQRIAQAYGVKEGGFIAQEAFQQIRGFGQMVQVMGNLLRQRKNQPLVVPDIEVLPFATRCQACQIRPANQLHLYFGEPWSLCDICRRKVPPGIGGARETRSQQVERFLDWLGKRAGLKARYLAERKDSPIHYAQDLNELGLVCQKRMGNRYIGFIYADGNRMGRALECLPTPLAYRQFSKGLEKAIEEAAYQALAENLHPTAIERVGPTGIPLGKGYIHPLEPLVIGGDDLMLIVPGNAALPVAVRLCQLFEQEMAKRVPAEVWKKLPEALRHPTLSAGVVIADSHNPVRVLQQVSKELCKSAKRRAFDEDASALDFLLIKSQSMLRRDVSQLRKTHPYYYKEAGHKAGRYLTAAPYTLKEGCRLLSLLKLMCQVGFPTSQLQSLVAALQRGRQYGSIHYLYQQARLKARLGEARKDENVLVRLPEIWSYDDEREPIPWHRTSAKEGREFASIVPDLLELYPFVPKPAPDDLWREILMEVSHDDQN